MKSIHSEKELRNCMSIIIGRDLTADEEKNYIDAMDWLNDPRRGYQIIDSIESALFWFKDGKYGVANFVGGLGLTMLNGGGCYGYFKDGLLDDMAEKELIHFVSETQAFGGIRTKGFAILGK